MVGDVGESASQDHPVRLAGGIGKGGELRAGWIGHVYDLQAGRAVGDVGVGAGERNPTRLAHGVVAGHDLRAGRVADVHDEQAGHAVSDEAVGQIANLPYGNRIRRARCFDPARGLRVGRVGHVGELQAVGAVGHQRVLAVGDLGYGDAKRVARGVEAAHGLRVERVAHVEGLQAGSPISDKGVVHIVNLRYSHVVGVVGGVGCRDPLRAGRRGHLDHLEARAAVGDEGVDPDRGRRGGWRGGWGWRGGGQGHADRHGDRAVDVVVPVRLTDLTTVVGVDPGVVRPRCVEAGRVEHHVLAGAGCQRRDLQRMGRDRIAPCRRVVEVEADPGDRGGAGAGVADAHHVAHRLTRGRVGRDSGDAVNSQIRLGDADCHRAVAVVILAAFDHCAGRVGCGVDGMAAACGEASRVAEDEIVARSAGQRGHRPLSVGQVTTTRRGAVAVEASNGRRAGGQAQVAHVQRVDHRLADGRHGRVKDDALYRQVGYRRKTDVDGRRVDVVDLVRLLVQTTEVGEGVDGVRSLGREAIGEDGHVCRRADSQGRYLTCVGPGRITTADGHVIGVDRQAGDA